MKKLIYATTVMLTCLAAIPVTLISSSIHAAAYAAEQSCQSTSGFATTGGIVRGQLDAIARCHSITQPNTVIVEQSSNSQSTKSTHLNQSGSTTVIPSKHSFCQSNLQSSTSGSAVRDQLSAIARCNSTSQAPMSEITSFNQSKSLSSTAMNINANLFNSKVDTVYPAYCTPLPEGLKPGSFEFNEALARCQYGS